MRNQAFVGQVVEILLQSPWIQPCGKRDRDEDPTRLVAITFTFAAAVAFFARSKAAVFSFTIVADEAGTEQRRRTDSKGSG